MSFTERQPIGSNKAIILDGKTMPGIQNTGATPMCYMVIIAAQEG